MLTNREHTPDFINIRVEELVGDMPYDYLDDYTTQAELRALSENSKRHRRFRGGSGTAEVSRDRVAISPKRSARPSGRPCKTAVNKRRQSVAWLQNTR